MPSAHSASSFAVFQTESSWGTLSSPTSYFIPLLDYGVGEEKQQREPRAYCGVRSLKKTVNVHHWPQGPLTCSLFGFTPSGETVSFAEYLLQWAFAHPEQTDRPSKSIRWIEGGSGGTQRRHAGMRVNQASLAGQAGGFVTLSLDLIGKEEAENVTSFTPPNDRAGLWKFLFADATFSLGGSNFPIESFNWQVDYHLRPGFNDFGPSVLRSESFDSLLTITPKKTGNTWEANHRAEAVTSTTATLFLEGLHGGTGSTGTRTQVEINFNSLSLAQARDAVPQEDYIRNPLSFKVLKPNNSTKHVTQTWREV